MGQKKVRFCNVEVISRQRVKKLLKKTEFVVTMVENIVEK